VGGVEIDAKVIPGQR